VEGVVGGASRVVLPVGAMEVAHELTEVDVVHRGTRNPISRFHLIQPFLTTVFTPRPAVQLRSMQDFEMGRKTIFCKPSRVSTSMTMIFLSALVTGRAEDKLH